MSKFEKAKARVRDFFDVEGKCWVERADMWVDLYGFSYEDLGEVLRSDFKFYRIGDVVFANPEQLVGCYIGSKYGGWQFKIEADGVAKTTQISKYNEQETISYEIVDIEDDSENVVGFNIILGEDIASTLRDAFCFIYKDCVINGVTVKTGMYCDFTTHSSPMGFAFIGSAPEKEIIHRLDSKFMPLLIAQDGTKYELTVSPDGMLSAIKVNE